MFYYCLTINFCFFFKDTSIFLITRLSDEKKEILGKISYFVLIFTSWMVMLCLGWGCFVSDGVISCRMDSLCFIYLMRMDILVMILSGICLLVGLVGCVLPALPGPPIAYVGILLLHFTDKVQFTTPQLVIWCLLVVVIQLLDNFIPMLGAKYSKGSKWGSWGAFIGSILGLFFLPWGLLVGPFLGAVVGELLGDHSFQQALKSGVGSLLGFLFGTILKLVICTYFIVQFITSLW